MSNKYNCNYPSMMVVLLGPLLHLLNVKSRFYVIVRIYLSSCLHGILMVKILNQCILNFLVHNFLLYRQCNRVYTPHCFHTPVYWLSS